jgi:hypothetical protein
MSVRHDGVQDESVARPIPRDIHEPDQLPVITSTNPAEAVAVELKLPIKTFDWLVAEALSVERFDLGVSESAPPFDLRDPHSSAVRAELLEHEFANPRSISLAAGQLHDRADECAGRRDLAVTHFLGRIGIGRNSFVDCST